MAGEVSLICQMGRERMQATGGAQMVYVLVEARPNDAAIQTRMPLNLALVLDHSGSMKGAKLQAVKEAVKLVIDHMDPQDIISVVVFDDNVRVIVPAQLASDKYSLKAQIDGIRDGGGTAMSLGMNVGLTELRKYAAPNLVSRMVLLTDGVTYGDADRCRRIADDAGASGVGIYPLGIGADWDEDLLDNIGQRSSGMPAEFIRRPDDALNLFSAQLQSAAAVAVRNTQMTLRLAAGVTPKRAVKVLPIIAETAQNTLSDREATLNLGDVERATPQAVLFELLVEPKPVGTFRLAQAELSYEVPGRGVGEGARRRGGDLHQRSRSARRDKSRRDELRREVQRAPPGDEGARRVQEDGQGDDGAAPQRDAHPRSRDAARARSARGGRCDLAGGREEHRQQDAQADPALRSIGRLEAQQALA